MSSGEDLGNIDHSARESDPHDAIQTERTIRKAYDQLKNEIIAIKPIALRGEANHLLQEKIETIGNLFDDVRKCETEDMRLRVVDADVFGQLMKVCVTNSQHIFDSLDGQISTKQIMQKMYLDSTNNVARANAVDISRVGTVGWRSLCSQMLTDCAPRNPNLVLPDALEYASLPTASPRRAVPETEHEFQEDLSGSPRVYNPQEEDLDTEQALLESVLEALKTKNPDTRVNLMKVILNPRSYTQSHENFSLLSILVKDGRVRLYDDPDGERYVELGRSDGQRQVSTKPLIFTLKRDSWQNLIREYLVTESYIADRPDGKNMHANLREPESDMESINTLEPLSD